jgi:hypothetical protein
MNIRAKRIRSLTRHLAAVRLNTTVIAGLPLHAADGMRLSEIGFRANHGVNAAILPGVVGPITDFNANGGVIIHKDQPLEPYDVLVYSTWLDWHGNEHSGYVTRTYHRHPRTPIPAPEVELRIAATTEGESVIITPPEPYAGANSPSLLHNINLLLEIFGQCEVFTENLDRIIQAPVRRLNWRLLPPGRRPFDKLRAELEPIIQRAAPEHQDIIARRLETINGHGPEFVAVGEGGFTGYVVFGFPRLRIHLFESMFIGNATYVFGDDWERLSQLTKSEILENNLALGRVFHRDGWHREIGRILD